MKLSVEKIKKITFGAVRYEECNGELHFYKCTKKQCEAWYNKWDGLGERSETSTGITLDFITDAKEIVFEVCGSKFETFINGNFNEQFLFSDEEFHKINLCLNGRKNRITLLFPNHDKGALKSVELNGESFVEPHKFERKILFLGDSITQGWNSKYDFMSYPYQVADSLNAERVINGIGGAYYLPESFDHIDFDPDTVVVAYGTNDFSHYKNIDVFKEAVNGFLEQVKNAYCKKRVIVITPIFRFGDLTREWGKIEDYISIIKTVANSLSFEVIDGYDLVPQNMDFYADAAHPNDLGFSVYARKLISKLS